MVTRTNQGAENFRDELDAQFIRIVKAAAKSRDALIYKLWRMRNEGNLLDIPSEFSANGGLRLVEGRKIGQPKGAQANREKAARFKAAIIRLADEEYQVIARLLGAAASP